MSKQFVCLSCGFVGKSGKLTRGNIWIEIILWLCFAIPGFIYSIWRETTKQKVCSMCKSSSIIPADSPKGRELLKAEKK